MNDMKTCTPFCVRKKKNLINVNTQRDDIFWSNGSKCHLFFVGKQLEMEG